MYSELDIVAKEIPDWVIQDPGASANDVVHSNVIDQWESSIQMSRRIIFINFTVQSILSLMD